MLLLTYTCIALVSFSKYSQEIHKEVDKSSVLTLDILGGYMCV
jgi:hypothetical protein